MIDAVANRLPPAFRLDGHPHAVHGRLYRLNLGQSGYRNGGVRCRVEQQVDGIWHPWRDDVALQELVLFAEGLRPLRDYRHGRV